MAEPHPSFPQPGNPSISVWRYTDLSKFVWMLQQKALYLCRADTLPDQYEGYITRRMADPDRIVNAVRAQYEREGKEFGQKVADNLRRAAAYNIGFMRKLRSAFYVNCWHANQYESSAMWRLYTSVNDAICIRSTYRQLWDCLPNKACFLGEVSYLDYERDAFDQGNLLNHIVHKRASFSHEHEVRAVMWVPGPIITAPDQQIETEPGKVVPVDLQKLIQEIYVAPDAKPPLMEVVQGLLDQAGLKIEVKQSGVNAPPAW